MRFSRTSGVLPTKSSIVGYMKFRIQDSGFRIQDSGFRIQDSGFRIQDSGFRIQDSGHDSKMGSRTPRFE
jgi:hypothetical protein